MSIFNRSITTLKQPFTVNITLEAETEQQAQDAAKTLSRIATFFSAKELAAVQKALNNPAIRAIIKSKI
ncbi:MAG: hypothetical protein JST06_08995 [Bacteroidetes bacterium]|nr:hypothetical protein [Bacteroidota bacterium]MBS1629319.1 hypothetical protein [Bacteroidota bacterium]